ncbi:MAG: IS481 family transposase [Candidatus Thermofonsia Clade 3 bacterium]|uniref:IS481 family transposase n=1 Tax=Candidatus Thermofonsia Clade 3 bacterium TaxID=2364212 RepID=A0A2M8Q9P6_9CHLR|nr:MAG: IS481 family transposase [Candidatus Thermofonsia Clade 3 bacterium]
MITREHKCARTTARVRAEIAASQDSIATLAERYCVSPATVFKWKHRTDFEDRSHTAHRLQTTLTPAQEMIVVELRKTLLLSLDDLLAVTREFINPDVSRSGLDRCLRRHGVSNLKALRPQASKPACSPFAAYEPGFVHIDVKYLPPMADERKRRYLFVAIERATRWVFVQVKPAKTARAARAFLAALIRACPIRIRTILTDNGKEFTDRFVTTGERSPSGQHVFDELCAALGIEHRLTRVRRPQTNGMVERFNGRIAEVLRSHHFVSGEDLQQTLMRYAWLYNHHLPQAALNARTPVQAMKSWYRTHPHLFHKRPYDRPGCDM